MAKTLSGKQWQKSWRSRLPLEALPSEAHIRTMTGWANEAEGAISWKIFPDHQVKKELENSRVKGSVAKDKGYIWKLTCFSEKDGWLRTWQRCIRSQMAQRIAVDFSHSYSSRKKGHLTKWANTIFTAEENFFFFFPQSTYLCNFLCEMIKRPNIQIDLEKKIR